MGKERVEETGGPTGEALCDVLYEAVVFKETSPTADFGRSEQVVLPGEHSEQDAWAAVRRALEDPSYIGGRIRRLGN